MLIEKNGIHGMKKMMTFYIGSLYETEMINLKVNLLQMVSMKQTMVQVFLSLIKKNPVNVEE